MPIGGAESFHSTTILGWHVRDAETGKIGYVHAVGLSALGDWQVLVVDDADGSFFCPKIDTLSKVE